MGSKDKKETIVLKTFLNACSDFREDASSIKSCNPPEPDCLCEFSSGRKMYFELSEVIDQSMAQKFNDPKLQFTGGFFGDEILTDRIKEKFTKKYETSGLEVDLLLYFDLQPPWPEKTMVDQVGEVVSSSGNGLFKRVWLFSVPKIQVIGTF